MSGSTTFLYHLWSGKFEQFTVSTTGFNIASIRHKSAKFTLWDVGGQKKLRPEWKHYLAGTN
ncbi:hypothetical protein KUTeg_008888, partial [Tegillarca granosa]